MLSKNTGTFCELRSGVLPALPSVSMTLEFQRSCSKKNFVLHAPPRKDHSHDESCDSYQRPLNVEIPIPTDAWLILVPSICILGPAADQSQREMFIIWRL